MKRLLDVLIVLVLLAAAAVVAFVVLGQSDKKKESTAETLVTTPTPIPVNAGESSGYELPRLTTEQLQGLLTRLDDLPGELRSGTASKSYIPDSSITSDVMRRDWPAAADRFDQLVATYAWEEGVGIEFDTCHLNLPVTMVSVDADQFASTATAQAFIDDPLLRNFIRATNYHVEDSLNVHGFVGTALASSVGSCGVEETNVLLDFEYWGLMFSLSADVRSTSDPQVAVDLLYSLVPPILTRVESAANTALPPTPVPAGSVRLLTEAFTLVDLSRLMPTLDELDESLTSTYATNSQVGKTYSLDQYVAAYRDLGYAQLADQLAFAGGHYGMVGEEVRFWDTGSACPSILAMSLEIDISLFGTAAGAQDHMADPALQEAWKSTGLMGSYQEDGDGVLMFGQMPTHHCGAMQVIGRMVPYERLLVTVVVNSYSDVPQQDVLDVVDGFSQAVLGLLFVQKLP